jgi:hypothetical protein
MIMICDYNFTVGDKLLLLLLLLLLSLLVNSPVHSTILQAEI